MAARPSVLQGRLRTLAAPVMVRHLPEKWLQRVRKSEVVGILLLIWVKSSKRGTQTVPVALRAGVRGRTIARLGEGILPEPTNQVLESPDPMTLLA